MLTSRLHIKILTKPADSVILVTGYVFYINSQSIVFCIVAYNSLIAFVDLISQRLF